MTLVAKPKRTATDRKRRAQHHRQSKLYLKTYWPYLPMLAIVFGGIEANKYLFSSGLISFSNSDFNTRSITRVGAIFPSQSDSATIIVAYMTIMAVLILSLIYWRRLRKIFLLGEEFVVEHPWLDISLVAMLVVGTILTRQA